MSIEALPRPGTAVRIGPVSGVVRLRQVAVPVIAFVVLVLLSAVSLGRGDFPIGVPDVLRTLVGLGEGAQPFIVLELRAPRVAVGLLGAVLLLTADVVGRVVARPGELQVGIVLALIGAPFFVALVRRRTAAL